MSPSPAGSAELTDFASWGLNVVAPEVADDRGYWETLSWENADKYQPDLIIVDNRSATTTKTAKAQPTWTALKAAAAGQVDRLAGLLDAQLRGLCRRARRADRDDRRRRRDLSDE